MALIITEEQQMLKTSAKELLKEKGSVAQLRKLRDEKDPIGFDKNLWNEMVQMGWTGLTIPETYGGLDFGYTGLGQVLEETGRTLTVSPLNSTVLLCATAVNLGGNVIQKEALLSAIAEGKLLMAFASDEGAHHNPTKVETAVTTTENGLVLNGTKTFVLDGHVADKFIVVAKTNDKIGLFVVDANAKGISRERIIMMDSRNVALVKFDNVSLGDDAKLDSFENGSTALLEKTLDIARIGLAAEMLGGIQETFERTLAYLKERQQFGIVIKAFRHGDTRGFAELFWIFLPLTAVGWVR